MNQLATSIILSETVSFNYLHTLDIEPSINTPNIPLSLIDDVALLRR